MNSLIRSEGALISLHFLRLVWRELMMGGSLQNWNSEFIEINKALDSSIDKCRIKSERRDCLVIVVLLQS